MDDRALVRAHQEGDPDAFAQLFERYRNKVYGIVYRVIGDVHEAADLTQEIFVRIHGELASFRFDSRLSTWLYRVAMNRAINRVKERERRARIRERIARERGTAQESSPDLMRDEGIQRAIGSLSPKLRAIVGLRYLEGLSYEEIAEILELSLGTVKSRLFFAHETLRPLLKGLE